MLKKTQTLYNFCFYLPAEHEDTVVMEVVSGSGQIVAVVFSEHLNMETPTQIFMALIYPLFIYVLIFLFYA